MKEKIISIQQIKEAMRLHRALEITSGDSAKISFPEMLDRVVQVDQRLEIESADSISFFIELQRNHQSH